METPEITQELKAFLRENKYVNICMREGCIKKCIDVFCREHNMHTCSYPNCNRRVLFKHKEFCGQHTEEAREKNSSRTRTARNKIKRCNELEELISAGKLIKCDDDH